MTHKNLSALLILALLLGACAAQPLPPPEWGYEKDAIKIHLKADDKLNLDDGAPHTLVLCTYQLKDPNTFNQLSEDADGIYKLLECGLFDGSVATARRLIVRPGQDLSVNLDRAADAQFVALVAGYYQLQKERMIRLYDIPVVLDQSGLVRRTTIARPGPLTIDLTLGPLQIEK
jgi:type VI secretion system VasD/TssJ family lipoprotein